VAHEWYWGTLKNVIHPKKPDNNRDIQDLELFRITNIPVVVRFYFSYHVVQAWVICMGDFFFVREVSTYKDSSVQGTWTFALGHGLSGIASSCQYGNTCSTRTHTEQGGKGEAASLVLSWILAVLSSRLYDYFLPSLPIIMSPTGY
jgi:hypothetical protein